MRVAVIGGGLLGCATAANIARVQEIDTHRGRSDEKHEVTVFCHENELGGADFRSVSVDGVNVEVGRYRTLPHIASTYLADLFSLANGEHGHFNLLGRRIRIPGDAQVSRGKPDAVALCKPWKSGSYGRLIRSFGVWNFTTDSYSTIHKGWPLLDALRRVLRNEIWRALFVAALVWSTKRCLEQDTFFLRGQALVLVVVLLAFVVLSPAGVVDIWQRTYSFWGSTLPMLVAHGLTAGIARGSTLGFVKALSENNTRNRATCAPSLDTLLRRTGLHMYVRGSGADYTEKFKYDESFVTNYIATVVEGEYAYERFANINSLACHFTLLDADYPNSDAAERICSVAPTNSVFCAALLEAARATTPVDVRLAARVTKIIFDDASSEYTLQLADGRTSVFDAVVLAECPAPGAMHIDSPHSDEMTDLLVYDASESRKGPATHLGVVKGVANASFFRFALEYQIPDVVCMTESPYFARLERVCDVRTDTDGVYLVYCSEDFESSGALAEMFEEGAELVHFEKRARDPYRSKPVIGGGSLDDQLPPIVLGKRFVYAASSYAVARHPEMDAMAAINAASLLSKAVNWESVKDEEGEKDSEGDDAENDVTVTETNRLEDTGLPEDA